MSPIVVLLFALFGGVVGVAFDIPAIYRANAAPVDLSEILADIPASTESLQELSEGLETLGEITGALNFGAVDGIDFSGPISIPDTLPFPFEPSAPGAAPPPLGGAAQDIFTNFLPNGGQGTPEEIVVNLPEEFQGFRDQFARFGGNFGNRKGLFETVGKEVNVLDDILSQN